MKHPFHPFLYPKARGMGLIAACAAAVFLALPPGASATTFTVNNASDNPVNGLLNLRQAFGFERAETGDTIVFDPALDGATIVLTQPLAFRYQTVLTVDASALPNGITISGAAFAFSSILEVRGGALDPDFLTLVNITFRDASIAAIRNDGSFGLDGLDTLTMRDCQIIDCFNAITTPVKTFTFTGCRVTGCDFGVRIGGILGNTIVRDCEFTGNSASPLLSFNALDATVERCLFENNGGNCIDAFFRNGDALVRECSFLNNAGFGVRLTTDGDDDLLIDRSTFANHGDGALILSRADTTIVNSTFSGNGGRAAVEVEAGIGSPLGAERFEVRHCTFADNVDGAINFIPSTNGATVEHSVFSNNTHTSGGERNLGGNVTSDGWNLVAPNDIAFDELSDNGTASSGIGPLGDNGGPTLTHAPLTGSPAIDAGDPNAVVGGIGGIPFIDQRGFNRKLDSDGDGTSRVNIGAVETAIPLLVTTLVDENLSPGTGVSLREALASVGAGAPITFDPSLNGGTIDLSFGAGGQGSPLLLPGSVTIDASSLPNGITITSGNVTDILRTIVGGNVSLHKITFLEGARAITNQGGASINASSCVFRDCTRGTAGGAIFNDGGGSLFFNSCFFLDNNVNTVGGAAIYSTDLTDVTLNSCWFQGNTTLADGGAIYLAAGSALEINYSCFISNSALDDGGAIFLEEDCELIMRRSTVVWNTSGDRGGGISADGFSLGATATGTFLRCTIGENRSGGVGGGVYWSSGPLDFDFCTIYRNVGGGGVAGNYDASFSHCILAENRASSGIALTSGSGSHDTDGHNLLDISDPVFFPGIGDIESRPALLSPLAWHGGAACPTYMPLANSPAIDNGDHTIGGFVQDARGFFFVRDGNNDGLVRIDIGAVEAFKPIYVTTNADQNGPSLPQRSVREAIRDCAPGGRVLFDPSLDGKECPLTLGQLSVNKPMVIDATSLPSGFAIDAQELNRGLVVQTAGGLSMHAVSIHGGKTTLDGGAIRNRNSLTLSRAALYQNEADGSGGAIQHDGFALVLDRCTLNENSAATGGGAIKESGGGLLSISHSTIAGNASAISSGGVQLTSGDARFDHSILALNLGTGVTNNLGSGADGTLVSLGHNLENTTQVGFLQPGDIQNANPLLERLDNHGGWSLTMAPAGPNSPVVDAGSTTFSGAILFDQRGAPALVRVNPTAPPTDLDIGAHEFSSVPDTDRDEIPDWWELAYGLDPDNPDDATADADLDGDNNLSEFRNGTDPLVSDLPPEEEIVITEFIRIAPNFRLKFRSQRGRVYQIWHSPDLAGWTFVESILGNAGITTRTFHESEFGGPDLEGFFQVRRP